MRLEAEHALDGVWLTAEQPPQSSRYPLVKQPVQADSSHRCMCAVRG